MYSHRVNAPQEFGKILGKEFLDNTFLCPHVCEYRPRMYPRKNEFPKNYSCVYSFCARGYPNHSGSGELVKGELLVTELFAKLTDSRDLLNTSRSGRLSCKLPPCTKQLGVYKDTIRLFSSRALHQTHVGDSEEETRAYAHTHTHNRAQTHAHTHTHTHTTHHTPHTTHHTRTHAYARTHAHAHGRTHARTHARTRARTHARTRTHTHTHTCTNAQQKNWF